MTLFSQRIEFSSGEGKFRVEGVVNRTGNGTIVSMIGGEEPHIGAVAVATPRLGLKDNTKTGATCSVYTLLGHRDDEIAKPAAEEFAKELGEVTIVIAGIHIKNAYEDEIKTLVNNAQKVTKDLLREMKSRT